MQMSRMIEDVQKHLGVNVDGKPGPETWGAIHAALVPARSGVKSSTPPAISVVDERSERNIATLMEQVRAYARALVQQAAAHGIQIKIIGGLRTDAEQDTLYAQGRTTAGPKVTNARGGHSTHNFGIAFDVGVFSGEKYLGDSPKYKAVGVLGEELGLEWGGNWSSIVDQPHFQLRPLWAKGMSDKDMLTELRRRRAAGLPVYG